MAFGTIMLNTDAHNEHVQNKMTEKQFVENIHYTSGGGDIPTDFLLDLYGRIVTSELKFTREEMTFPDAIKWDKFIFVVKEINGIADGLY